VIAEYVKVLQELAVLKGLERVPEVVLPLPKKEMVTLLQRSTHPNKEQLIELLGMFESSGRATDLFLGRLIGFPVFLSLVYVVAIALQGASWLWVPIALLGGLAALITPILKWNWFEAWATLSKWSRWGGLLLVLLGEAAVVVCWGAVWVRLVIISGLYGLYQSIVVRLDGFGIFAALLSLVLGYFFSKEFNAFFFFVVHYTRADDSAGRANVTEYRC
jgi:hypothetical protein